MVWRWRGSVQIQQGCSIAQHAHTSGCTAVRLLSIAPDPNESESIISHCRRDAHGSLAAACSTDALICLPPRLRVCRLSSFVSASITAHEGRWPTPVRKWRVSTPAYDGTHSRRRIRPLADTTTTSSSCPMCCPTHRVLQREGARCRIVRQPLHTRDAAEMRAGSGRRSNMFVISSVHSRSNTPVPSRSSPSATAAGSRGGAGASRPRRSLRVVTVPS